MSEILVRIDAGKGTRGRPVADRMSGAEWLKKYPEFAAQLGSDLAQKCVDGIDRRNAEYEAARTFWDTATYKQKERQLLQDLAHCRCRHGLERHCNSCGPVLASLKLLKEDKL